jgi:LuxR family maltose regulon positive regulatory protein
MCGPLCDAVLGVGTLERSNVPTFRRSDDQTAYSQPLLEHLERANLFVTPLDAERHWYRYHHLFGEVLRERLRRGASVGAVATLHRRASAWYEQHGLSSEAIQHALMAGDSALAARLIEPLARSMRLRGEMLTLMGWLSALPADAIRARPHLAVIYAWGLATTTQTSAAEHWLQEIEQSIAEHDDRDHLLGEVAVIRVTIALVQGDYPGTLRLAHQALAQLSDDQPLLHALVNMSLGSAYSAHGDLNAASQHFARSSALYQAAGHRAVALAPLRQLARVLMGQGRLNQAEHATQQALRLAAEWGQRSPLVGYTYLSLGELRYERNDLAAAGRSFADGLALVELGGARDILNTGNLVEAHLGLARVRQAQGDEQGALDLISRSEDIWERLARGMQRRVGAASAAPSDRPETPPAPPPLAMLISDQIAGCRVRLWLRQGDIGAASEWTRTWEWNTTGNITLFQEARLNTLARVLIARGGREQALVLLERLLASAEAGGRMGRVIEVLALQALALQAHGQVAKALVSLERALALAEPEGYIRTFVDEGASMAALLRQAHLTTSVPSYVEKLLAAFSETMNDECGAMKEELAIHRSSFIVQPLVEPLTARELEVLGLLAEGASNDEIARRLIVSLGTVKKHISNIFGKLQVESRTQAAARARALGLL